MLLWKSLIAVVLLASFAASANAGGEISDDEKILNKLEFSTKYNKIARPPPDYNTTNIVNINFVVLKILGINEVGQSMSLEGFTEMEWNDRRLAWIDKSNGSYNKISKIYLPRSSIWIPDVITINTMQHNENKLLILFASVLANGRVLTSVPFNSITLCDINMQYFPFDSQTCSVIIGSWHMSKEDLELRVLSKNTSAMLADVDRQINIESDEYCITKRDFRVTSKKHAGNFQEAVFNVTIQRKPLFYVMNLIVPSLLILVICVFSFFVPPESGERLSLNITLMLALTVFLQIVAANTPAQSDHVPMLTLFFSAVVVLSAVSTVGSMFQIYCYFRGQTCQTVDSALVRLVILCRLGGGSTSGATSGRRKERATNVNDTENPEEQLRAREDESVPASRAESEWLTVARRLDNGLFIIMLIATGGLGLLIGLVRNPEYVVCR